MPRNNSEAAVKFVMSEHRQHLEKAVGHPFDAITVTREVLVLMLTQAWGLGHHDGYMEDKKDAKRS